jgi:hypothetical protein
MSSLVTPQQFLESVAANKVKVDKATLDYAELVKQHDTLAEKIVSDLEAAERDLDTLMALEELALRQSKETMQIIFSLFGYNVVGNIATTRAYVTTAKNSIVTKG